MVRFLATALAVAASITACFSPEESDGVVPCGANDACPPGFTCGPDHFCYRQLPPIDAAVSIDAVTEDSSIRDAPISDAGDIDALISDAGDIDAVIADAGGIDALIADASGIDALIVECNDGTDNDCDGQIDWPNDPGCLNALDPSELGTKECDDGIDNDGDDGIDFHQVPGCGPTDPQCSGPDDPKE